MKRLILILFGLVLMIGVNGQTLMTSIVADQKVNTGGSGYCAEFQAVYDSWTTKPSSVEADDMNTMVESWKADGFWAKQDIIYVFDIHTNSNGEALVNWKNPGTHNATIVLDGGTMNFTAFQGFQSSNGAYLNTNYDAFTEGIKFLQNDASIGVMSRTNNIESNALCGAYVSGHRIEIMPNYDASNENLMTINCNSGIFIDNESTAAYYIIIRNLSSSKVTRRNTSVIDDNTSSTSATPPDLDIHILNRNGLTDKSTKIVGFFFIGGALTSTESDDGINAHETYIDNHGGGVI